MEAAPPLDRPQPPPDGGGAPAGLVSLEGIHRTVEVPSDQAGFWRNWRAFVGPALLVSVGYMDPGN
ncbi:MAG: divalent metal cation transporter, partial [Verrucomicrobiota bacterium]